MVNGHSDPVANGGTCEMSGFSLKEKAKSVDSEGNNEGKIQISQIKIITKHHVDSEEETEKKIAKPAEVLTKTLAQAIRLINEQKVHARFNVLCG